MSHHGFEMRKPLALIYFSSTICDLITVFLALLPVNSEHWLQMCLKCVHWLCKSFPSCHIWPGCAERAEEKRMAVKHGCSLTLDW